MKISSSNRLVYIFREQGGSQMAAHIQRRVQIATQEVDVTDGIGEENAREPVAPSPHQDPARPLTPDQHQDLHLLASRQTQLETGT